MQTKDFRMTHQRRVILQELRKVKSHPTADEIYLMVRSIMPRISLGTVYRNLEILSEMGLIRKIEFSGNMRRYDGNVENHYHIKCQKCGRVDDIPDEVITALEYDPAKLDKYNVTDYSLHLIGICEGCRSN